MLAAIWIIAAILLALWSLAAWGLHGLLQWLGSTSGELQPLADRIPWSGVLDSWLPGWQELLRLLLEFSASALAWAGGAVPLIAWVVWALGAGALLLVAGGLTLLVVLLRDSSGPKPAAA